MDTGSGTNVFAKWEWLHEVLTNGTPQPTLGHVKTVETGKIINGWIKNILASL